MRSVALAGLVVVAVGCKPALEVDCEQASLEALPVVNDASECVGETHPSDVVGTDACLAKMREALELMKRTEAVCSGEVLSEIRRTKEDFLAQIPKLEKSQAYYRGEVDADDAEELMKVLLEKGDL